MINYLAFTKSIDGIIVEQRFSACHVDRAWEWLRILQREDGVGVVVVLIDLDTGSLVSG